MTRRGGSNGGTLVASVRCAIYTRKSTDEGLDQDFNSLDAQREAGEAYITSQRGQGWTLLETRYDDGGFTGSNLDRPALARLLSDIEAGRIDCVVIYKLDRLSRSLLDFARLVETFDRHGVCLVSVTQPINTADSTGRLMLNILLSFAQFEREVIADRTRDKIHAARKRGKYTGGVPILGYRLARNGDGGASHLEVDPGESEMVREIFQLYLKKQSLSDVTMELERRGWTTKGHATKTGRQMGGRPFSKSSLHHLLKNPLYIGKHRLKGEVYPAEHAAIIDEVTWRRVQALLRQNGNQRGGPNRNRYGYLLRGLVRCAACNAAMTTSTSRKGQRVHRYYVCSRAQKRGYGTCPCPSVSAQKLESVIVEQIRRVGQDRALQREVLRQVQVMGQAQRPALVGEQRRLTHKLGKVRDQIRSLLDALATGERGASVTSRIAELEDAASNLERRLSEIAQELAAIDNATVDENDLVKALSLFDPIWDVLYPSEQARVIQLLIERIEHDGRTGILAIEFAASGIKALADELDAAKETA